MTIEPRIDIVGAALADGSRSRILCTLMDGRAFTNKELACAATITEQTASAHLKHLEAIGLTRSLRSGRHVYHRINGPEVAHLLETLAGLSPTDHLTRVRRSGPDAEALTARSCYDHIAGRLGVLIAERLAAADAVRLDADDADADPKSCAALSAIGIDGSSLAGGRRVAVRRCLDWTERRFHVSGALGAAVMDKCLEAGWLERRPQGRALIITSVGRDAFAKHFGISSSDLALKDYGR